ncbi:MAG: hypothetical protein OXF75_14335, partial [Acidimicrobiaceae bacterium]|nr:hypothetical protein [Acidimicrobiaceae bacterium]
LDRLQACRAETPRTPAPPAAPLVSVAAAAAAVAEGRPAAFTVTADPAPAAPLTVVVTVTASGEYGAVVGARTAVIPTSGTASLTIATTGDGVDEPDGTVTLTVNPGSGYTATAGSAAATATVRDDDDPPPDPDPEPQDPDPEDPDTPDSDPPPQDPDPDPDPVPVVGVTAGADIAEGRSAVYTITATPAPAAPLAVTVTVAQTGEFGATTGSRTVVVPTTGSAQLSVTTVGDSVDEPDGTVTVTVNAGSGYSISGAQGTASVAVADDDATTVALAAAAGASVAEDGGSRDVTVTLNRALAAGEAVTAPLAVTGATAGAHYTLELKQGQGLNAHVALVTADPHSAQNPAVVFTTGAQQATLALTAAPNTDTDSRTVRVAYGTGQQAPTSQGLSGGVTTTGGPVDTAIANDDQPPPTPTPVGAALSVRDAEIAENARYLRLLVHLSDTPDETVTVQITTQDRTAENGADYRGLTAPSRPLVFAKGTRLLYRYIYIPILDDNTPEQDETFQAVLANPTGAPIQHGTATITIKDND